MEKRREGQASFFSVQKTVNGVSSPPIEKCSPVAKYKGAENDSRAAEPPGFLGKLGGVRAFGETLPHEGFGKNLEPVPQGLTLLAGSKQRRSEGLGARGWRANPTPPGLQGELRSRGHRPAPGGPPRAGPQVVGPLQPVACPQRGCREGARARRRHLDPRPVPSKGVAVNAPARPGGG